MSKRKPITVNGVTYSPLELKEGDTIPEDAYYRPGRSPLRPTRRVRKTCLLGDTNRYYTKAKTVIFKGVEYAILGPSDGTDYGYQSGDIFRCVSGTVSWLRPVGKTATNVNAEPTVTFKLTVAEAEDHLDILYKYVPVPRLYAILEQALRPHRDSKRAKELEDRIAELQKELDGLQGNVQ